MLFGLIMAKLGLGFDETTHETQPNQWTDTRSFITFGLGVILFYTQYSIHYWIHSLKTCNDSRKWTELLQSFASHIICTLVHWLYYDEFAHTDFFVPSDSLQIPYIFFWCYWCLSVAQFFAGYVPDKDVYILGLHHIVTMSALFVSGWLGYRAIGLYILYLHDVSDIFISGVKICFRVNHWITPPVYICCVVVWIWTRLYLFGWKLVAQSVTHALLEEWNDPKYNTIIGGGMAALCLWTLFLCHIWWTWLLLRIGFHYLFGSKTKAHSIYDTD